MRSALDDFLGHVKAIERTLDLRDGLVMFGQEPVRQGAPAIAKVHRSVRKIGLSGLQPSLDGGVLLLVAALEQFVTDLIVDFSSLLPGIVPAYDDLPSAIRSANERLTGEALVDRRSRFSDYERERFVQNLRDCQQGVVPYVLNGEALALVNRNLNATVLEEVIGRLGIGDIWTVVSKTRTLQRWSGRGGAKVARSRARNQLADLIYNRNQIAHRVGRTAPGPEVVREYISFERALARALVRSLEQYARTM